MSDVKRSFEDVDFGDEIPESLADVRLETVHVFTVNGSLTRDKSFALTDGLELTILPPVGGG